MNKCICSEVDFTKLASTIEDMAGSYSEKSTELVRTNMKVMKLTAENEKLRGIMQSEALLNTSLHRENDKLERIVEVLEKSNDKYAEKDSWLCHDEAGPFISEFDHERVNFEEDPDAECLFITIGGKTARQAKEEVERIRGEGI